MSTPVHRSARPAACPLLIGGGLGPTGLSVQPAWPERENQSFYRWPDHSRL